MSEREEFEKWISHDMAGVPLERSEKHGHYLAPCLGRIWRTWRARQPEIDALKQRILELEASYEGCEKANEYNKAVIKRIGEIDADTQKDAKRIDFLCLPGIELSMDCDPEPIDDAPFVVSQVNGGRNDREWTELGRGRSVREAIDNAMKENK